MPAKPTRRATNLSLDVDLLAEARRLEINLSRAAEAGIRLAISERRSSDWVRDNRSSLESSNAYVSEHGLPLSSKRRF